MQATEAVKLIVGSGEPLVGKLLLYDALAMGFTELTLRKDPNCPACGTRTLTQLIDYDEFCGVRGEEAAQLSGFEVAPFEVAPRIQTGEVLLLDVREPMEFEIARIEGAKLIPLRELPDRAHELPLNHDIVAMCHHGMRSAQAVGLLRNLGFKRVWNLAGGIDAWSAQVDEAVPRY
jgi:adenylyltransferase/sulfurtransferase